LLFSGCTFLVLISGSVTTRRLHHSILFFYKQSKDWLSASGTVILFKTSVATDRIRIRTTGAGSRSYATKISISVQMLISGYIQIRMIWKVGTRSAQSRSGQLRYHPYRYLMIIWLNKMGSFCWSEGGNSSLVTSLA
jgi:hypothetical protein